MKEKRISQDGSVNYPRKISGGKIITRCYDCDRYMITLCQDTGRAIKYPMSGGIPEDCPLQSEPEEA